ncbi:MAG: site-2 protease family protein [Verrucomicrobia bacterium]|nr:MAG: site-2 protease family protein [Verrucomicrobiota bacterium]
MEMQTIIDGLLMYVGLVVLLTFHEFGHAWMAWKCGDDTAKSMGRCSLNPLVHIDLIGTVLLPLVMIFLPGAGRFLVGWAKPVPVNISNLRNPRWDDILVSLAGPWMNLALAVGLMLLARVGMIADVETLKTLCTNLAGLSLILCFFNLIPIPPLDGSQVVRALTGMSYETYAKLARFGFIAVILVLNIPFVRPLLSNVTNSSLRIIGGWFGVPV